MTDTQLVEGIAALLRAYATAPLADLEVHSWEQQAYEDTSGFVVVMFDEGGAEVSQAIGSHETAGYGLVDDVSIRVRAVIPFDADTLANRQQIETVCAQIRYVLRDNRQASIGGETLQRITAVRWRYGWTGEGQVEGANRACEVMAICRKPVTATP